ncbi:DUF7133 domain-containing protein [Rufibacter tibetensis]|uniref:Dehydrogenase n=1 Tax=Rufibacter tibetensis TaxID=512763 RepID=A0A0P0CDZ9_9BACT|nr:c-type cytochrome [Rufibacter tibetensis]ALJ00050.1 dehydrogenase [Rufibacter tibetensis]
MKSILYSALLAISCAGMLQACQPNSNTQAVQEEGKPLETDSVKIREMYDSSPVLSPGESLKKMQVEEGFTVELVAAEPLINSPVAMTFDEKGRMWVAEMQNYMPDTAGTGEELPTGKIVILEDKNGDGTFDDRKVFLDSLVLPRALSLVEDGLLVAMPPNLWYYEINQNKPGKKTLVDNNYTQGGNVEHEPNGLLRAMDNWIYSAKFTKRYRKKGDKWLIEKTHFRGQWGIAKDDQGRLYYNNNSQNLLGDYFAPGMGAANANQQHVAGFDVDLVGNNRVYPARATTGVNRGYQEGILNKELRLVNFTAACGPVIYRGGLFGERYSQNAFVAEPAANLIKRNILNEKGYQIKGTQAYAGREFLASTDERFRPVNLYDGPDGGLYVLDMYRGVIQHKFYLTDYLAKEIAQRHLEQPITCGRIYRVVPAKKEAKAVVVPQEPLQLVKLLEHKNGWVRDKAQQLLVDKKYPQAIPALRQLLKQTKQPVTAAHALWSLEGMNALLPEDVLPLLKQPQWSIRMQALSVLPSVMTTKNYTTFAQVLGQLVAQHDSLAAPYVAFLAPGIRQFDKPAADRLVQAVVKQYPANKYVADAAISSMQGREEVFYTKALAAKDTSSVLHVRLREVLEDMRNAKRSKDPELLAKEFPVGARLYKSTCQSCHGADGNGVKRLAPPLNNSNWVTGSKSRLIPIVLYGMTGPVKVNGMLYQTPDIIGEMPGIGHNKDLSDKDIAELLSFIRKSWNNNAGKIEAADVEQTRKAYKGRQKAFTMGELNTL